MVTCRKLIFFVRVNRIRDLGVRTASSRLFFLLCNAKTAMLAFTSGAVGSAPQWFGSENIVSAALNWFVKIFRLVSEIKHLQNFIVRKSSYGPRTKIVESSEIFGLKTARKTKSIFRTVLTPSRAKTLRRLCIEWRSQEKHIHTLRSAIFHSQGFPG